MYYFCLNSVISPQTMHSGFGFLLLRKRNKGQYIKTSNRMPRAVCETGSPAQGSWGCLEILPLYLNLYTCTQAQPPNLHPKVSGMTHYPINIRNFAQWGTPRFCLFIPSIQHLLCTPKITGLTDFLGSIFSIPKYIYVFFIASNAKCTIEFSQS